MNDLTGIVFDIQRGAMHDGPGIRTTVFLKGCPLRCQWCHNPESMLLEPQVVRTPDGDRTYGRVMTVARVMAEVLPDRPYYQASGGGLTLSGGEPTVQFEFCRAILLEARRHGVHACLDTSGHCATARLLELVPLVAVVLFDYKATGAELHRQLTGVSNAQILANLAALHETGADIVLRCPMVPGLNDTPEHFAALGTLSRRFRQRFRIEVLPFHRAARGKYEALGRENACRDVLVPDERTRERWRDRLVANGVTRWTFG